MDSGVQDLPLVEGGAKRAMQTVFEIQVALPGDDVCEEVAVVRRIFIKQRRQLQRVFGRDQLVQSHGARRDSGPIAGLEAVDGIGARVTYTLEDHIAIIGAPLDISIALRVVVGGTTTLCP